ncbi:acyl-CoA dehydrogenase [Motiliproteus sp. SC1-56]|uniref:acyl-CoA dehydrogenase n=1 Tax=Motiliproteus sp. SC1-56 TaxID=2799565 RepID=UPI001A8E8BAB|nr:acyl-CoA dehydrogenase [Motiliproteus sp. SC1-56]
MKSLQQFRRNRLSRPIFKRAKAALPGLSDTEREALTAGDVWWDQALFSGHPDWDQLLDTPPATLSDEEQAFLNGPVDRLCAMLDEWEINRQRGDLPPEVWDYLKDNGFFAMIIPREYGGLAFSAFANSEVVRRIASRSVVTAVTVMVPNSLGPGELLMHFGTQAQRDYWLPRLADGRELPCFGLTSSEAGSDAAAMRDRGRVCRGTFKGQEVLGIRLQWSKRYITLSPVATVLGLAFKLEDPDHLLGEETRRGITLALVPTDLPGVTTGRRHLAAMQFFQNGPTEGQDVFIPLDYVIGGVEQVGKGWPMLMSALAAGRGISLPSLAAAATALAARTTGAYARIRHQFGIPIGEFEGVQERLGVLAADAYMVEAARRLTCAGLDQGYKPSVVSAIMKVHTTYRMRESIDHALDVHAGKAVIDGPGNYLSDLYRAVPVSITVEGANILTRSMIIFGQGAIRCHPWLLKEMLALEEENPSRALDAFDEAFWGHAAHTTRTLFRAWIRSWSGGLFAPSPDRGSQHGYFRQLSRYSAVLALLADGALLTLGGDLKRREMLSARLGDMLAELYLLSAVLKRWQDEGRQAADRALVEYNLARGLATLDRSIQGVLANLPNRPLAVCLKLLVQPLGVRHQGPSDRLTKRCARLLLDPGPDRERLTPGLFLEAGASGALAELERCFQFVTETAPLRERLHKAGCDDPREALRRGLISDHQAERLEQAQALSDRVIAVDDFPPGILGESNFTPTPSPTPSASASDTRKAADASDR